MAAEAIKTKKTTKKKRKKGRPIAIIDTSGCTGCEVCIEVCPVDCIITVPGEEYQTVHRVCEVIVDDCIGCELCAKFCPWETIDMMVPPDDEETE